MEISIQWRLLFNGGFYSMEVSIQWRFLFNGGFYYVFLRSEQSIDTIT